jgi:hypothetical protein
MMGTRILALEARPSAAEIKSDVMSGVRKERPAPPLPLLSSPLFPPPLS